MYKLKNTLIASASLIVMIALAAAAGAQEFSDWSAPVNLGPVVNSACAPMSTACNDQHPAVSKDGLSLYFSSDRPGGCGALDIWVSQRDSVDSPWEEPFNLGCTINSVANDFAPNLTTNGRLLFFHSFRETDNCGGSDIYYAHRKRRRDDLGWETPRNLNRFGRDPEASLLCGPVGDTFLVNTPNTESGPTYFQDEATDTTVLYFTRSDQPTNLGDFDIYLTTLASDGTWGMVVRDNELSTTPYRDTRTAIRRRDGLEMILSTERPGGLGNPPRDLWVSTRASTQEPWSIPVHLANVNTAALEGAPALSWDGTDLYFFSARPGGLGANDLYLSTRTKLHR